MNIRRPLNDPFMGGYLESDKDYVLNNLDLCVRMLNNYTAQEAIAVQIIDEILAKKKKADMIFQATLWELCLRSTSLIIGNDTLDVVELDKGQNRVYLGVSEDYQYEFANKVVKVDDFGSVRIVPLGSDKPGSPVVVNFRIDRPITLEDLKP